MTYDADFWHTQSKYHALAQQFEQNIERVHPGSVTSNRLTGPWFYRDTWNITAVDYFEYRGPSIL